MISPESQAVADKARELYEKTLRDRLEREHGGEFVCIEPVSGDHFLGRTFDEAANPAIDAHPDRFTYTLRIGHSAALHIGAVIE